LTRQLASLVQSGMPIDEGLQAVARQTRKEKVQRIMLQVRSRVTEGLGLAQAMAEHPRVFDDMYRAMVGAGEKAGFLGPVLGRLAEYTENSQHMRQKLQSAIIYPIVLMLVTIAIVTILMVKVVPELTTIFARAHHELPISTTVLIAISDFLSSYGLLCIVGFLLLVIGWIYWLQKPSNQLLFDRFLLKIPAINHIIVQSNTAQFAATLGLLLDSGVPLLDGLRIASQVMRNRHLRECSSQVSNAVQEGSSLHKALDKARFFPPLLVQMAASGEMNGTLAEQLRYTSRNQERELGLQVSSALTILEPLTIVIMAIMVGFIMYAILMPIFNMNDLI
jgi:general secretion pathway protein F